MRVIRSRAITRPTLTRARITRVPRFAMRVITALPARRKGRSGHRRDTHIILHHKTSFALETMARVPNVETTQHGVCFRAVIIVSCRGVVYNGKARLASGAVGCVRVLETIGNGRDAVSVGRGVSVGAARASVGIGVGGAVGHF